MVRDPYDAMASYYDLVTADGDVDLELYAAFARRLDAPVLELGAGTGRVAVALARQGFRVYGLDRSAAMLAIARVKAEAAGVPVELREVDLCGYRYDERFGLILCAAESFLHLTEAARQLAALRLAGDHLAAGGRIVLDLPALSGSWADWEPGVRPLELHWSGPGPGGMLQYFVTFTCDPSTQQRHTIHIFDELRAGGIVHRTVAAFDLRFIFPGELALLVEAAGLRLLDVYGGYDLEPFAPGCERMIAVIGGRSG